MGRFAIWGASGHGSVAFDAAALSGEHEIVGFLDDDPSLKGQVLAGSPVLGGREVLQSLRASGVSAIHVAVGDCEIRLRIATTLQSDGFALQTVVHPRSIVASSAVVGSGTLVAAGAIIGPGARVGRSVILNTASSVDHDCVLGDAVHLAPGVRLGGLVNVGEATFVGIGAIVLNCLRIGERCVIGGGAVVVKDLPAGVLAYGVPARVVRERR